MNKEAKRQDGSLDHVLKYTGFFGGVQGLNILISVVRNKLVAKILGTAGIGLMGYYITVVEFINQSANLGIPLSSVQQLSELFESGDKTRITHFIRTVRTWCVWTAFAAVLLCAGFSVFYGWKLLLLTPMAVSLLISAGELSVLKGMRHLKRVAAISVACGIATFCLTIPFFWAMGSQGIILALDCSNLAAMVIHLAFTLPRYPWHTALLSRDVLREGIPLLRIGLPYVLAGIAGSGVAVALQTFLRYNSGDVLLGYYRVGYTLMVSYAALVFSALDADYFPRLSSVNADRQRMNHVINQQVRACLLMMTPMLIIFITGMPIFLQLLYTSDFLPATNMTVCAAFYLFFRCMTVPIGYTALARRDSRMYLLMEVIYDVVSLALIIGCYLRWSLMGIGIGLSLSALFDLFLVGGTYRHTYGIRLENPTILLILTQGVFLAATVAACLLLSPEWKYAAGVILFLFSAYRSYLVLRQESSLLTKLRNKLHV